MLITKTPIRKKRIPTKGMQETEQHTEQHLGQLSIVPHLLHCLNENLVKK